MAPTADSPGAHTLGIPTAWTSLDSMHNMQDAFDSLEEYKKKDLAQAACRGVDCRAKVPNRLGFAIVVVRFKAVGNAPIMKQNRCKIAASNRFQAVIQFLRKQLGWKVGDPLFTYINLAFAPAPDDTVSNLYKAFATEGFLIVNYSTTAAWG